MTFALPRKYYFQVQDEIMMLMKMLLISLPPDGKTKINLVEKYSLNLSFQNPKMIAKAQEIYGKKKEKVVVYSRKLVESDSQDVLTRPLPRKGGVTMKEVAKDSKEGIIGDHGQCIIGDHGLGSPRGVINILDDPISKAGNVVEKDQGIDGAKSAVFRHDSVKEWRGNQEKNLVMTGWLSLEVETWGRVEKKGFSIQVENRQCQWRFVVGHRGGSSGFVDKVLDCPEFDMGLKRFQAVCMAAGRKRLREELKSGAAGLEEVGLGTSFSKDMWRFLKILHLCVTLCYLNPGR
ncbi:hypothetical protein L2E82_35930 [Cichorium intybus]|uniref:Uncharacterized protein n=1 Tax=Cichorium intybus TaxID=13427 RepID=A0ACB9BQA1_CICIN|nr:hypothetical protein L2E82_35930 [Cichorium intybus]